MNPAGLFGPGETIRAMIPATKPINTIQSKPDIDVPALVKRSGQRDLLLAFHYHKRLRPKNASAQAS
jgi:hypothetical protein